MIDYDTILSTTEGKLTLLQWLKKVEAALKDASATTFKVNKKGDATLTFSIVFADGTELESGEIVLQQGESVESAAIVNGHLILTLTNGDELDAGDLGGVTSFSIDAAQHLIVTYQNGTTQDLGAIFTGNVNIDGNFTANSIIENMPAGVSASLISTAGWLIENVYTSVVKNGNKLTLVSAVMITKTDEGAIGYINATRFNLPASIMNKLYEVELESGSSYLANDVLHGFTSRDAFIEVPAYFSKYSGFVLTAFKLTNAIVNRKYYVRYEKTFLLNDGLI